MRRRDFVKVVITGSLGTLACPRGGRETAPPAAATAPGGPPASAGRPAPEVSRETFAACHALRDGTEFTIPKPSRHLPVIIVGGGPAGLVAARELGDRHYLLLEKEEWVGGNATGGEWRGVGYSSGTSYNNAADVKALAADLGVRLLPIASVDGAIVRDTFVPDFLTTGLDRSPYPPAVRDGFRKFFDTYAHYDVEREAERLDNQPFAEILKAYPPELRAFFDSFGPNSWAARVEDTSAYVGIQAAQWAGGLEPARYTGEQGFGLLTRALGERVKAAGAERLLTGRTVIQIRQDGDRVLVAWTAAGNDGAGAAAAVECVSADTVIVAAPKFIARHIVAGLPEDQKAAMGHVRYAPYMVANVCFDGVVHEACFDTNVIGPEPISDFVCADWPSRRGSGPADRPTVLTCYMPLVEQDRYRLLDEDEVRGMALAALDRIDRWFPGAARKCGEIRVRLRGHPMHFSAPGMITRWGPASRRSLGAIHFAGTDGIGDVSEFSTALQSGRDAAGKAIASLDARARRRG
ncbi:MAG TPA: FAD-dependent oxidoreductase [Patescibacteria group bacterium]|nr:FAD-dependent oxidoreductase [Patescibacteria group bacterium]